jgi:hypothetical protein
MKSSIDWKLGLWWILATVGGLFLGLAILFAGLGTAINNAPPFIFGLVLGCTFGLGCAVLQWLALRRLVSAWWIAATFAVWATFWTVNLAGWLGHGSGVFGMIVEGLGHGAVFGALLGLFQWLVLRSKPRMHTGGFMQMFWAGLSARPWEMGSKRRLAMKIQLNS